VEKKIDVDNLSQEPKAPANDNGFTAEDRAKLAELLKIAEELKAKLDSYLG